MLSSSDDASCGGSIGSFAPDESPVGSICYSASKFFGTPDAKRVKTNGDPSALSLSLSSFQNPCAGADVLESSFNALYDSDYAHTAGTANAGGFDPSNGSTFYGSTSTGSYGMTGYNAMQPSGSYGTMAYNVMNGSSGSTFYGSDSASTMPLYTAMQPSGSYGTMAYNAMNGSYGSTFYGSANGSMTGATFASSAASGPSYSSSGPSSGGTALLSVPPLPPVGAYNALSGSLSSSFDGMYEPSGGSSYGMMALMQPHDSAEMTLTSKIIASMPKAKCKQRLKRRGQTYTESATVADLQVQVAKDAAVKLLTADGIMAMGKYALKSHLRRMGQTFDEADSHLKLQQKLAGASGVTLKRKKNLEAQRRRNIASTQQKKVKAGQHQSQAENRKDGSVHPPTKIYELMCDSAVDAVSEYLLSDGTSALKIGHMKEAGKAYYGRDASQPAQRFMSRLRDYNLKEILVDPGTGIGLRGPQINRSQGGLPQYEYKIFGNDNWDGTLATAKRMLKGGGMRPATDVEEDSVAGDELEQGDAEDNGHGGELDSVAV